MDALTELKTAYERACEQVEAEAKERGIVLMLSCDYRLTEGVSFSAYAAVGQRQGQIVKAPDPREAMEEAIRRVTWDRDVNMKRLEGTS